MYLNLFGDKDEVDRKPYNAFTLFLILILLLLSDNVLSLFKYLKNIEQYDFLSV